MRQILHLEKVGIHDNFFDLGGHSLLVLRVKAALDKELTRSISVVDLFQFPTIHTLATFLEEDSGKQTSSTLDVEEKMRKRHEGKNRLKRLSRQRINPQ